MFLGLPWMHVKDLFQTACWNYLSLSVRLAHWPHLISLKLDGEEKALNLFLRRANELETRSILPCLLLTEDSKVSGVDKQIVWSASWSEPIHLKHDGDEKALHLFLRRANEFRRLGTR